MLRHVRLLFVAFTAVLLPTTVMTVSAQSGHPTPPAGWKVQQPALSQMSRETLTIPGSACATFRETPQNGVCQILHYSSRANHLPVPAGAGIARAMFADHAALAAAAYWYYSNSDYWCSVYGCWYLGFYLSYDGVANGSNVWKWDEGCTPGGLGASITWCGYSHNGGGYPTYAMQYGLNGQQCITASGGGTGGTFCYGHGIRVWVDDYGNPYGLQLW